MRRRSLLGGAATVAVWPVTVRTQSTIRPRVGFVSGGSEKGAAVQLAAFRGGLAQRGYVEPSTFELIPKFADGHLDRVAILVRELIEADIKVLVTSGIVGARAAKTTTQTLPIVIAGAIDILDSGLVASLARPGGNVTGLTQQRLDTAQKEVELLAELVPGLARLAVLMMETGNVSGAVGPKAVEAVRAAASRLGVEVRSYQVATAADVDAGLTAIVSAGHQAMVVVDAPLISVHLARIAAVRLPVLASTRDYVEAGALASFGASQGAIYQRAAYFVDRILKGAKPADLPVEQPTKFELVINMKTARSLGLTISPSLLARADEVIE